MTQESTTLPRAKTHKQPKPTINSFQASYIDSLMRAKGYKSKERINSIITSLSSVKQFGEITFDEARYLITRLPSVGKEKLDMFMANEKSQRDIGVPPYRPFFKPSGKSKGRGGKG